MIVLLIENFKALVNYMYNLLPYQLIKQNESYNSRDIF